MKTNLKQFLIGSVAILVFVFYFGFNNPVSSSVADNVSGYAWNGDDGWIDLNSNGIKDLGEYMIPPGGMGWLSFNCTSGGNCGTSNYGVNIDSAGNILGYAWAGNSIDSNINGFGWIKFGGLSGFPSGPGTISLNAKLAGNNITGWARACAVFQSGCSGDYYHGTGAVNNNLLPPTPPATTPVANSYLGGWDGWISLSGTGYGVTVNQSTGVFSGYAWGGSNVLGWIDFSQVIKGVTATSQLILSADATVVYPPLYQTKLRWNSTIPLTNCVAESVPATSSWTGIVPDPSSSANKLVDVPGNPIPVQYKLTCRDGATPVVANPVYVSRIESVALSNTQVVGNKTDLSWTTINIVPNSCNAFGSGGWSGLKTTTPSGSQNGSGSELNVNVPNPPNSPTCITTSGATGSSYYLTCTGFNTTSSISSNTLCLNKDTPPNTSKKQPKYIER